MGAPCIRAAWGQAPSPEWLVVQTRSRATPERRLREIHTPFLDILQSTPLEFRRFHRGGLNLSSYLFRVFCVFGGQKFLARDHPGNTRNTQKSAARLPFSWGDRPRAVHVLGGRWFIAHDR